MRNDDIRDRLKVENITDVQESNIEVVWTRQEARPRIRRKKDWRWYHLGEEKEGDRNRDGWTVSSERQKMKSITTELVG